MTAPNPSAEDSEDLPPLEVGLAQALAARLQDVVTAAAQASPGTPASAEAKKLVARRVPKSWLPKYEVMDEYRLRHLGRGHDHPGPDPGLSVHRQLPEAPEGGTQGGAWCLAVPQP